MDEAPTDRRMNGVFERASEQTDGKKREQGDQAEWIHLSP